MADGYRQGRPVPGRGMRDAKRGMLQQADGKAGAGDLTGAYFEENVINNIRSGEISKHLLKPISIKISYIIGEIGWRIGTLIFTIGPVFIFLLIFANKYLGEISLNYVFLIPIIMIMAYLLDCIYSLMICAMGFVFEEASSLRHLKWMLLWLFSGGMMPFTFLPNWLAKLASFLPFQLKYSVPVGIFQGTIGFSEILRSIILGVLWLALLSLSLHMLWGRNLKKFTAVGS